MMLIKYIKNDNNNNYSKRQEIEEIIQIILSESEKILRGKR